MVSRWYSIGRRPGSEEVVILGWSRDRPNAMARKGTIEAYYARNRERAAARAKADRGFDINWRKY